MTTITVSIGRDCSGRPLDEASWQTFAADVRRAVERIGHVVFTGFGTGEWTGDDGVTVGEDAWTLVAIGVHPDPLLRVQIADLADRYGQEAIALTTGETDLVEAAPLFQVEAVAS